MALSTFYHSTLENFKKISLSDFIEIMKTAAAENLIPPTDSEVISWKNNRDALLTLFKKANLPGDTIVAFELQLPISGGRIDCILCGKDKLATKNMIHIELKQWSNENVNLYCDSHAFSVIVDGYMNGSNYVAHPSFQVAGYQNCLLNYIKAFQINNIKLFGFSYCYNYSSKNKKNYLLNNNYDIIRNNYPLYCSDQINDFSEKLQELLCGGCGNEIFVEVSNSEIGQTERLYDVAAHMLDNTNNEMIFELVADQVDAFNTILDAAKSTPKNEKTVVIVRGGPGTGKSVIALRLLSKLYDQNFRNVYYATRSSSLRNVWKRVLQGIGAYGEGSAGELIKSTFDFRPYFYDFKENGGDVLLVDEAHRIQEKSGDQTDSSRYKTDKNLNCTSNLSQILGMLYTSRVSVFFIDDKQSIDNKEIGLSSEIKKAAESYKERINKENQEFIENEIPNINMNLSKKKKELEKAKKDDATDKVIAEIEKSIRSLERKKSLTIVKPCVEKVNVIEFELKDQFRCNGSNNFLMWLDTMIYEDGRASLNTDAYEFEVFEEPQELVKKIRSKDDYAIYADARKEVLGEKFSYKSLQEEISKKISEKTLIFNTSARIVAGWCWKWSNKVNQEDGDLLHEVCLPEYNFRMPWETKASPRGDFKFKYAKDADSWCNQKEGVNQIGCIHSIQGWETDYIGVILGPDITYDKNKGFIYVPEMKHSEVEHRMLGTSASERNNQLIKNIYRVLLTRGKKGCFVFATDPKVRNYIRKCINGNK